MDMADGLINRLGRACESLCRICVFLVQQLFLMPISYCYSEAHWDWMDGEFISTTELH